MQLSSVRAVITGGVSGLGLWPSTLVAQGGKVALFDLNDDKGAAAVAALGADKPGPTSTSAMSRPWLRPSTRPTIFSAA